MNCEIDRIKIGGEGMAEKIQKDVIAQEYFLENRKFNIWDCYSEQGSSFNNLLHFHVFYEMSIIYEGSSDFLINGNTFSMGRSSIQLIRPSDYHRQLTAEGEHIKYFNIMFAPEFISEKLLAEIEKNSVPLCLNVAEEDWKLLYRLARRIFELFSESPDEPLNEIFIRCNVENLCVYILKNIKTAAAEYEDTPYEPLRRAVLYIHKNYREDLKLSDAASSAGLSPTYFSAVFHKMMGKSFSQYLTEYRIQAAEKYLRSSDLPLKLIASVCGFASYSHFVTVFKNYYGVSPGAWRKKK